MKEDETGATASAATRGGWSPEQLFEGLTIRATSMIVTIYGDVVVPRGGVLWMGTLIEVCARFGISESLVRTAVSRLVAAERLVGVREGRRSYYRLAPSARTEFAGAARLLYEPIPEPAGWLVLRAPDLAEDEARRRSFAPLGAGLFLRPDHAHLQRPDGLAFGARPVSGENELASLAATLWPLDRYAAEYQGLAARFGALIEAIDGKADTVPDGPSSVVARLLLVHLYRHVVLADPLLPASALPGDWPGRVARHMFARLYLALSSKADPEIAASFEGQGDALPAGTAETLRRLEGLRRIVEQG